MSTGWVSDETLAPGLVISDRFRLQRMLGSGGMGSVWEASHLSLGTEIAIKFLDPRLSSREDIRSRFAQEATAAARIKSPHVVSILDYGFTEGGRGFIAMELLRGEDLGQRLERVTTLAPPQVVPIVTQACRGLAKAHALGTIHRDIKPENLFLVEEEEGSLIKLLDFGIAKLSEASPVSHKTDTGQILGTPLYMSPEQALGRPLDTRSDLYSLAVVAYRCLTGRPPFVLGATGELIVAVSTLPPPVPSTFNPSLPEAIDNWFANMLQKDPHARPCQTAQELADSFAAVCSESISALPRSAASAAHPVQDSPTLPDEAVSSPTQLAQPPAESVSHAALSAPRLPRSERSPRRRRFWPAAVIGLASLMTIATTYWLARPQGAPPAHPGANPSVSRLPISPPPSGTIQLRFTALPEAASLYLDGQLLAGNPHVAARNSDAEPHRLRAEAPGYMPAERVLTLERDITLELVLSPLPAPAPAPRAKLRATSRRTPRSSPTLEPAPQTPPSPAPAASPPDGKKTPFSLDRSNPWHTP